VTEEDGVWDSASASGFVDHESASPRKYAAEESLSSGTIVPAHDVVPCKPAISSGVAPGICAEPHEATESLCLVLHTFNAESVQVRRKDGSLASTSESAIVNEQDGSWDSPSASGFVAPESDSTRRHVVKVSLSSSTAVSADDLVACELAIASGVVSRIRSAPNAAPEPLCKVLHLADAQKFEDFATPQTRQEEGYLPSTSASKTVNTKDGSLASLSVSGMVSPEVALDSEHAIVTKVDDAAAERQVASAAALPPTPSKTPPRAGLVSQRLTEFAKRSQGLPVPSFATAECMPEPGLVPQRIQQFQSFIDQV
jgi:hypothetical protein